MSTFRFTPEGPFSLAAARAFVGGFDPFGRSEQPSGSGAPDDFVLVFLADDWQPAAVQLRQTDRHVLAEVVGGSTEPAVVRAQIARMLCLDLDGRPFELIADPVIATLRKQLPGVRPVLFPTPYEAACWALLSQRTRRGHAASMRRDLAARRGDVVTVGGTTQQVFPAPDVLVRTKTLAGASATKLERLRAVGRAALDGRLDAQHLRDAEPEAALAELTAIDGIGPFGAELVLVRGAGAPDVFPRVEPRLQRAMTDLYGLDDPDTHDLEAIAERWRPRRSWASFLIRVATA